MTNNNIYLKKFQELRDKCMTFHDFYVHSFEELKNICIMYYLKAKDKSTACYFIRELFRQYFNNKDQADYEFQQFLLDGNCKEYKMYFGDIESNDDEELFLDDDFLDNDYEWDI